MSDICSTRGDMRKAWTISVEMPDGKRPVGSPRRIGGA